MCCVHGKQLRPCQDGYLLNLMVPGKSLGGSFAVFNAHSFANNCQLALFESVEEEKRISTKECAGREGGFRERFLTDTLPTEQPRQVRHFVAKSVILPCKQHRHKLACVFDLCE